MEKVYNLTETKDNLRIMDSLDYEMIAGDEKPRVGNNFQGLKITRKISFHEPDVEYCNWSTSKVISIYYITKQLSIIVTKNSKILVSQI